MRLSVIVPLYKGSSYVTSIIKQIEKCVSVAKWAQVELILFNDYPEEDIRVNSDEISFEIAVINSEHNRGIHGARVEALKYSTGEYVLFLDQDDKIEPTYIESQFKCIGDADAVVCRATHAGRLFYTGTHRFEDVVSKEFIFSKWNSIVSPGQVLIKRTSIPTEWEENILSMNGADDYFLWLLMLGTGKKFALNQEVLFEHVIDGTNVSTDTNGMMDSELEMIRVLLDLHVLSAEDDKLLQDMSSSLRRVHVAELDNCKMAYYIMDTWLEMLRREEKTENLLEEKGLKRVGIYGAGSVGKSITKLIEFSGGEVLFYIDRNAEYIREKIPSFHLEDAPMEADAIIISLCKDVDLIEDLLKQKYSCPVYKVNELITKLKR